MVFDGKTTSRRAGLHAEPPLCRGPQDCMEASCESAKRDELRPHVLGNVVKIIIKAVTTLYYLFGRLTRVPAMPRATVQGSLCAPPEVATARYVSHRYNKTMFINRAVSKTFEERLVLVKKRQRIQIQRKSGKKLVLSCTIFLLFFVIANFFLGITRLD